MITLHNPTTTDVIDYWIEEFQVDKDNQLVLNRDGKPLSTGRTLEWSLVAGETAVFDLDYVAQYLLKIFGFLEEIKNKPVSAPEQEIPIAVEVKKGEDNPIKCKFCGQGFKTKMNYGVHLGSKHQDMI